jgi:hypothetical protein
MKLTREELMWELETSGEQKQLDVDAMVEK